MTLRRRLLLQARWVLAGFVLAVSMAAASPLLQATELHWVCGQNGQLELVALDAEGQVQSTGHGLDCALCLLLDGPVSSASSGLAGSAPAVADLRWMPARDIPARWPGAALPARGPPAVF